MRLFLACVVLSVAAQAATQNVTVTVTNAAVTFVGSNIQTTGPITITNTSTGATIYNGTFVSAIPESSLTGGSSTFSSTFTVTLSDGDTISGNGSIPASAITSGS